MSVWAQVIDVQAVYEDDVPDRTAALLDRAETLLRHQVPSIDARITDATLDVDLVRLVIVDAVIRALRNPRGYSWEREGDYSYGYPLGKGAVAAGGIWFLPQELDLLKPGSVWSRVGTIALRDPYKAHPLGWRRNAPLRYEPEEPITWGYDPADRRYA